MTEAEARRLIDDKLPTADGDRMAALRSTEFGTDAIGFLMDMEQRAGRSMTTMEIDAMETEGAVVAWLTATR